jgi:polyisoprenoid-binding protein YceI
MNMMRALPLFVLVLAPIGADAAPRTIAIVPPTARITYTAFALGLVPVVASFDQFRGTLLQDPARPGDCHVKVTIDIASLRMDDPNQRRQALAPDMLDVAHHPTMSFNGACQSAGVTGKLTLHGITRPITLAVQRDGTQVTCTASVARQDFGINGMSNVVAPDVRIRITLRLPS